MYVKMNIAFRADSSIQIGSGHLMRCLTLADCLKERGAQVTFICRELPGNLIELVEGTGYPVYRLKLPTEQSEFELKSTHSTWLGVPWQSDADEVLDGLSKFPWQDWLIVDHYALDHRWEETLRPHVGKIMVIDDLADRPHDCNLLLDQNLYDRMEQRYDGLVPSECRLLLGPRHALLRSEFIEARRTLRKRDGRVRRILVFFGGSDASNETEKALTAIQKTGLKGIVADIIVGMSNPHNKRIKMLCAGLPWTSFHSQVNNMAELMVAADLAIGAGGSTTWERCALALPAIVIAVAHNQVAIAEAAELAGVISYLGIAPQVCEDMLQKEITRFANSDELMLGMSQKATLLVDGEGIRHVVRQMELI